MTQQPLIVPADASPVAGRDPSVAAGPDLGGSGRPLLDFIVRGLPVGQGNIRHLGAGRPAVHQNAKTLKPWREAIRSTAAEMMLGRPPVDGPVILDAVFTFPRPASHYRTGRNAHLLRPSAPRFPAGRPDLSHLVRAVEDSLTAMAFVDDARIVDYGRVGKRYPLEGVDALPFPGVLIRLYRVAGIG